MIDTGPDAQRLQRTDSTHPRHQLLADAKPSVAAVQPGGQLPVFHPVAFHVAIQQVQINPAYTDKPYLGQQRPLRVGIVTTIGPPVGLCAGSMGRFSTCVCRYSSSCQPSLFKCCLKYPWL